MTKISIRLMDVDEIDDAFLRDWRDLDQHAQMQNPYFSSWFLPSAMKYLGNSSKVRLCVLRGIDDGCLLGLSPLVTGMTYAKIPLKHFTVWKHDHCYNGAPLFRQGFAQACFGALMEWIDARPEGARFLRFVEFPMTEQAELVLKDACKEHSRRFLVQSRRERAVLTGGQTPAAVFEKAFSGKKRKELRRQARRLGERGVMTIDRLSGVDDLAGAVADYVALEVKGWKGRREDAFPIGRSEDERNFFAEAVTAGAREGAVICDRIFLNDEPAAMLFSLRSGDEASAFKIAHDEKVNDYSPGVLLLMEATRKLLSDQTLGKLDSCARSGHPIADRLWRERMPVVQINIPASGALNAFLLRFCASLEKVKNSMFSIVKKEAGQ